MGVLVVMIVGLSGCSLDRSGRETKKAEELFGKWIATQKVFNDIAPAAMSKDLPETYPLLIENRYRIIKPMLAPLAGVMHKVFVCSFDPDGDINQIDFDVPLVSNLAKATRLLDHDMPGFINYLKRIGLNSPAIQSHDKATPFKEVIRQYNGFLQLFFLQKPDYIDREFDYLRAVANRMFEFGFGPATWPQFYQLLLTPGDHPIARLMYAAIWYYLAGNGWKHWHRECLDNLKLASDQGKRVVYIAGGNDIYQLIKHGIYNIDLIDPILPTQPTYYSEGWAWLVRSEGLGDQILFTFKDRTLVAERTEYKHLGFFKAKLCTGEWGDISQSLTTWTISDKLSGKELGTWVIHRRFATQADFRPDMTKELLISFNELYFVATQNPAKTWGINPTLFDDGFSVYVKQLRRPVTKAMIENMGTADASDFNFIALGTETN